jgi:spore maturation protein CgeB
VAGPQYPATIRWPRNVARIDHVAPSGHCLFYNSQRFTLNVTRRNMVQLGFSPSVRLFEAAACGVPIISDEWDGLDQLFVRDREIVIARTADDVLRALREMSADDARAMGSQARARVLREHTSEHRALELEQHVLGLFTTANRPIAARPPSATLH